MPISKETAIERILKPINRRTPYTLHEVRNLLKSLPESIVRKMLRARRRAKNKVLSRKRRRVTPAPKIRSSAGNKRWIKKQKKKNKR